MSYIYHGTRDLIVLPTRSVQTFPSGLVRIERSFACRKEDAGKYRRDFEIGRKMPFDDGRPAIDGLFIFPDAQEQLRQDGFVEFRVTAYGRTNAVGAYTRQGTPITLNASYQEEFFDSSTNRRIIQDRRIFIGAGVATNAIHRFAAPAAEPVVFAPAPGVLGIAINNTPIQDIQIIPSTFSGSLIGKIRTQDSRSSDSVFAIGQSFVVGNVTRTNFGFWDEYVVDYRATASDTFLGTFFDASGIGPIIPGDITATPLGTSVNIFLRFPARAIAAAFSGVGLPSFTITPGAGGGVGGAGANLSSAVNPDGTLSITVTGLEQVTNYTYQIVFYNSAASRTESLQFRTTVNPAGEIIFGGVIS
jgi:hypothetical protein